LGAALALALLALVSQSHLCYVRGGRAWPGAFASGNTDEPAYAAFLGALINIRPRRICSRKKFAPAVASIYSLPTFL
jgi:hypothetical protein